MQPQDEEQGQEVTKNVSLSVRLTPDLHEQLLLVCRNFGINPNAYLRQVVGKAIYDDLGRYRMEQSHYEAVRSQLQYEAEAEFARKEFERKMMGS